MKVLIACEFSARVRESFKLKGHDAWSCDLLPSAIPGNHYIGDVRDILNDGWDLMIAHPPCTELANSGARWWKAKEVANPGFQQRAIEFVLMLMDATIPRICLENPIGAIPRLTGRKYSQIVHPWQFGHGERKPTCLWLKNLPELVPTNIVEGREQRIWRMPPSADRGYLRSITYQGIADAMADQWNF